MRWLATAVGVGALVFVAPPAFAERVLGLAQLATGVGCIAQPEDEAEAVGGCGRGRGLIDATDVVVTPDGRSVYVAAVGSDAVSAFAREAEGKLRQVNCVSANATSGVDGTKGACADGNALAGVAAVAVSPDGRHVYSAAYASGGLGIFARQPESGRLRQIGCVRPVRTCTRMRALGGAVGVAVSPDGRNVYAAAADANAVVSFTRDPGTGLLAPLGCISDDGTDRLCATGNALRGPYSIVVSPDGRHVYVAAYDSNSVLTFARDATTGTLTQRGCVLEGAPRRGSCVRGYALVSPVDLAITRDGRTVFAAANDSNSIVVFARDAGTGLLRELGCVSEVYDEEEEERDGCAHVQPLSGTSSVSVSPDGATVYATHSAGVTLFVRDTTTGTLRLGSCVTYRGYWDDETTEGCTLAAGIADASSIVTSPDGRNVYVTSYGSDAISTFTGGVSVAAPAARLGRRLLSVRVGCPASHLGRCFGRVVLTPPPALRHLRQSVPYSLGPGASGVVQLRLRRALIAATRRAPVPTILSVTDTSRYLSPVKRLLVLRGQRAPKDGRPPKRP